MLLGVMAVLPRSVGNRSVNAGVRAACARRACVSMSEYECETSKCVCV